MRFIQQIPTSFFSVDDTTLFVFEGTSVEGGDEEWDWKIIDSSNSNSGVRSDFDVWDDAENSGGLRVCLTFTFTASGMLAPLYVSVSGLANDELSVEACPDGAFDLQSWYSKCQHRPRSIQLY